MNFNDRRKHLRETYKTRKCFWCKKPVKDCDSRCQCVYCVFHDNFDSLEGNYLYIVAWLRKNIKLYDKLFEQGLAAESLLVRKWKKRQLFTIELSGTKILDWTADYEIIGETKENHSPPNGFQIITPYNDYRRKKDLQLSYCQICGTDIVNRYYIKHEAKKLCICIGSECALAFCLSDVIVNNLKKHMRNIIEKEFNKLEKYLKNSLKEKIETNPINRSKFERTLERITRHFSTGRGKSLIPAQEIAKLLLTLEKEGFKVFSNGKSPVVAAKSVTSKVLEKPRKLEESNPIKQENVLKITDENSSITTELIRDAILATIRELRGVHEYAVNEVEIIQELQKHGISISEANYNINDMLQRNDIYEFTSHSYKIANRL